MRPGGSLVYLNMAMLDFRQALTRVSVCTCAHRIKLLAQTDHEQRGPGILVLAEIGHSQIQNRPPTKRRAFRTRNRICLICQEPDITLTERRSKPSAIRRTKNGPRVPRPRGWGRFFAQIKNHEGNGREALKACCLGDEQRHRCADQNQKSRKGAHDAYPFKRGHDPSSGSNNNGPSRLKLLSDGRHRRQNLVRAR
jgi:hypothetical protein